MSKYNVQYLDEQGTICFKSLFAFTAAMAEHTASQIWGGHYHVATTEEAA